MSFGVFIILDSLVCNITLFLGVVLGPKAYNYQSKYITDELIALCTIYIAEWFLREEKLKGLAKKSEL